MRRALGRRQLEDLDILVPRFGRAAAVDLEADDPRLLDFLVGLGVVDRLAAVDPQLQALTLAADDVVVPVAGLEHLGQGLRVGPGQHAAA